MYFHQPDNWLAEEWGNMSSSNEKLRFLPTPVGGKKEGLVEKKNVGVVAKKAPLI